jgi:hypothetical protein
VAKEVYPKLENCGLHKKVIEIILRQCANSVYAHNSKSNNATKPIEVKFYALKDRVQDQTISLKHISTKEMLADPLTKDLPPSVFREHITGMGLRESL